jgi:ABC-type transporter Mla MlaB component
VTLQGECNGGSWTRLLDEARALVLVRATDVTLDLADVSYLDSRGISALEDMRRALAGSGVASHVQGANGQPRNMLRTLYR